MTRLAFRNLWRRKRRTLITAASIGFGLWLAVLVIGVRESTVQHFIDAGAKGSFGYLTVGDSDFKPNQAQLSKLVNFDLLMDHIANISQVRAVVPRRVGESIIQSTSQNTGAGWMAIDPTKESADTSLFCQYMLIGSCGSAWTNGAIIGSTLAKKLRLKVDDSLVYTIQISEGKSISLMTQVHGIFHTGSDEMDGHLYLLPIKELADQLPPEARYVSFLAVYIDHPSQVKEVASLIREKLDSSRKVMSWPETQPDLVEFFAADRLMYYTLLIFIALIIASGVATCMNMNFIERRKEIGTLLAIGMFPRQILTLLLREAILLGGLGSTMGLLAVFPFYYYLNQHGWDVSRFMGNSMSVGGVTSSDMILHCTLMPSQFIGIVLTPMVTSLLSALVPAYLASHALPVEILREA